MKAKFVVLLATATMLTMLAGCGSSNTGAAPSGSETENIETTAEAPVAETATEEKADEGSEKYVGSWHEEIAGRGSIEISPIGDGKYSVEANWANSASEMAAWSITATYDAASGDLTYDDGSYQTLEFDSEGNDTVLEEKSVQGVLHLNDEGKIEWTDNAYESDEPSIFVK